VRGVDVHDVKTCFPSTQCCVPMPAAQISDVLLIHGPGLKWMPPHVWYAVDAQRYLPCQQVRGPGTAGP